MAATRATTRAPLRTQPAPRRASRISIACFRIAPNRIEILGCERFNLERHEIDPLARVLDAVDCDRDVEDLVDGLLAEDDE
jgi:hypothetical protein